MTEKNKHEDTMQMEDDTKIPVEIVSNEKKSEKEKEPEKIEQQEQKPEMTEEEKAKFEALQQEISEYKDRLLRSAAEFENFKKRKEKESANLFKYAAENFLLRLLPVIDDFERSMQHIDNAKDSDAVKKGIRMVYEKLLKALDDQEVKRINTVGQKFDVDYHEAVMKKKDESAEPMTILEEVEPGYMFKDKVIRHAKVVVNEE